MERSQSTVSGLEKLPKDILKMDIAVSMNFDTLLNNFCNDNHLREIKFRKDFPGIVVRDKDIRRLNSINWIFLLSKPSRKCGMITTHRFLIHIL